MALKVRAQERIQKIGKYAGSYRYVFPCIVLTPSEP